MTDILTKVLPRGTFVRCIANALKPDDILPPIAQNEGSAERIYDACLTLTLLQRICIDTHQYISSTYVSLPPSPYRR